MKNLVLYQKQHDYDRIFEDFIDAFQVRQMKYLASDLLKEGFSPEEIVTAVREAMQGCRAAGLDVSNHFRLVYTTLNGAIVRDCKLTELGYAWVLMNGPSNNRIVARWQFQLIRNIIKRFPF